MKYRWIIIFLSLTIVCPLCAQELNNLEIMDQNYPRSGFFRNAEWCAANDNKGNLREWLLVHSKLSGIIGKCLTEESNVIGNSNSQGKTKLDFFNAYKRNFPRKMVICHFNGIARMPTFKSEPFFDGHWLYYSPAILKNDIDEETSALKVSDIKRFSMKDGLNRNNGSDVCIVRKIDGKPDWNYAEQVQVKAVNEQKSEITVSRAMYGSVAKSFKADETYLAVHVCDGPYGSKVNGTMLWRYNFSLNAPQDSQGKRCYEILADQVASFFQKGNELELFDGIEFDAMISRLNPHYPYTNIPIDFQGIGGPSSCYVGGRNFYGDGMVEFLKILRSKVGHNKLILADIGQEAFHILNGVESEGFPMGTPWDFIHWYSSYNRIEYWNQAENCEAPSFSYIAGRFDQSPRNPFSYSVLRMHIAASCFLDCAYMCHEKAPSDHNMSATIWDELVCGTEERIGWLGKPVGPSIHLGEQGAESIDLYTRLKRNIEGSNIVYYLEDIPYDGELFVTIKGKSIGTDPVYVNVNIGTRASTWSSNVLTELSSYYGPEDTVNHYYFSKNRFSNAVPQKKVTLKLVLEQAKDLEISEILIGKF